MELFVSFVYPYKWTSEAVITPVESVSLTDLEKALTRLHILDVDVKTNKDELFNLFSFTAPSAEDARDLLTGYINYVSENVVKTVVQNMHDQLVVKTEYEREKPAQDRIKLRNQLDAKIQRLRYSLEIASAAGIVKPPYSNGQTIKDDPDFPISLGVDGIKRKLEIEKSLEDIAEINGDLRNRQFMLEKLTHSRVEGVEFPPFSYQARPSLPVRQDGPGKLLIFHTL